MKLGAAALLLFKQSAEAVITCSNGADLFTAQCTTAGFVLTVDETCRTADFNGIDFANSFVWGVNTVTSMDVPGCTTPGACIGDDVVAGSGVTCQVKPDGTTGAYTWTVPLENCATTGQYEGSPASGNPYYYYELYWNSAAVVDTANSIIQMNQIKFTCKLESLQEDAGAIVVSEGEMVADDEFKLNLQDVLQLSVYKLDSSTATMPTSASVYLQDGSVSTQTQSLTYETSVATTANLGDHMELRLEAVGASTVLRDYSVSLYKCWASKDALTTDTDGTDTSTTADTALQFPFWNEFCPLFGWVGPESYDGANAATPTGGAYLKEQWDQQTSIHAVHFRQFAFINTGFTLGTDSIYYHCTVKVCLRAAESTCSALKLDGTAATCPTYPAYSAAGRKKRSLDTDPADMIRLDAEVEAKSINYEDCKLKNGNICLEEKKKSSSPNFKISAAAYIVLITLYVCL